MIRRPTHLRRRQIIGRAFSTTIEVVTYTGARDSTGVWVGAEAGRFQVEASSVPVTALSEARKRELTEGGIRLDDARVFYTTRRLNSVTDASPGDILIYGGETWRVRSTERWQPETDDLHESVAVRQENQPTV